LAAGQTPSASPGETGPYVLLPATSPKPPAKPNGPTKASTATAAASPAAQASVAGLAMKRSSERGASACLTGARVRLQRAVIASGQARPAKL
jgi:hypothetical protein